MYIQTNESFEISHDKRYAFYKEWLGSKYNKSQRSVSLSLPDHPSIDNVYSMGQPIWFRLLKLTFENNNSGPGQWVTLHIKIKLDFL